MKFSLITRQSSYASWERSRHLRDIFNSIIVAGNQLDVGSKLIINVAPTNLLQQQKKKEKSCWRNSANICRRWWLIIEDRASYIYVPCLLAASSFLNFKPILEGEIKTLVKVNQRDAELMWSRFLCNQLCWHFQETAIKWSRSEMKWNWQNRARLKEMIFGYLTTSSSMTFALDMASL